MLRLSEAIRLGATLAPQITGDYALVRGGEIVGTCALGAALHAVGVIRVHPPWNDSWKDCTLSVCLGGMGLEIILSRWPYMDEALRRHVIIYNDNLGWSREKIADFVEARERELGLLDEPAAEEKAAEQESACVG